MTRIAYDTEFIDDGKTIQLISIGMVREDTGEAIYAVNREISSHAIQAHPWLVKHVWPSLPTRPCQRVESDRGICPHPEGAPKEHFDRDDPDVRPRRQIARMVERFILGTPEPELWAYYAAYDHVALAQLFGPMRDMPEGVPWHTMDIKQEAVRLGVKKLPQQTKGEHNALADAKHNIVMLRHLDRVARGEKPTKGEPGIEGPLGVEGSR